MGKKADKQRRMITRLTKGVAKYLKGEGAIKRAVNEVPEPVFWPDLEEALDFDESMRSAIIDMSIELDIELCTMPNGVYLGVCGERMRSIKWQEKQATARLKTIRRRLIRLGEVGTLEQGVEFARQMGFNLAELPPLLDALGNPLPQEVIPLLTASG